MTAEAISSTAHEAWHPDTKWEDRGTIELALMALMALSSKFKWIYVLFLGEQDFVE